MPSIRLDIELSSWDSHRGPNCATQVRERAAAGCNHLGSSQQVHICLPCQRSIVSEVGTPCGQRPHRVRQGILQANAAINIVTCACFRRRCPGERDPDRGPICCGSKVQSRTCHISPRTVHTAQQAIAFLANLDHILCKSGPTKSRTKFRRHFTALWQTEG